MAWFAGFSAGRRWWSSSAGLAAAMVYLTIPWATRVSIIAYAEGGLWFTDSSTRTDGGQYLCDYDGIYSLPIQIVLWLDTLGRIHPSKNDFHRQAIIEELGVDA